MDEHLLELTGKQLLILMAVKKGITTLTKDNYSNLSRALQPLLNPKHQKSPHRVVNIANSKLEEIHKLFEVSNEFNLAVFKERIKQLDIQTAIDKVTDYFVTNMHK